VDYGDGSVSTVDRAEEGKGDGVVTTKGDDSREGLSVFGGAFLLRVGSRGAGED
jgi:hypothetical protein